MLNYNFVYDANHNGSVSRNQWRCVVAVIFRATAAYCSSTCYTTVNSVDWTWATTTYSVMILTLDASCTSRFFVHILRPCRLPVVSISTSVIIEWKTVTDEASEGCCRKLWFQIIAQVGIVAMAAATITIFWIWHRAKIAETSYHVSSTLSGTIGVILYSFIFTTWWITITSDTAHTFIADYSWTSRHAATGCNQG